jgi:hypothetical protein
MGKHKCKDIVKIVVEDMPDGPRKDIVVEYLNGQNKANRVMNEKLKDLKHNRMSEIKKHY